MGAARENSAEIRAILRDLGGAAHSPFLAGEQAFVVVAKSGKPAPRVVVIGEDEHLPLREQVERTALFAYVAVSAGSTSSPDREAEELSPLQGFPPEALGERDLAGTGYRRLAAHASTRLARLRSELFLRLATGLTSEEAAGLLLRLGSIETACHATLGKLLESRRIDVAVGLDTTQPDLGEQDLYRFVGSAKEEPAGLADHGFLCESDVQVVRTLRAGERTGLFWRHKDGRVSSAVDYEAASCYAHVRDRYVAVRLDVVTRRGELQAGIGSAFEYLANTVLFPPKADLLKNLKDVLGSIEAPIPTAAERVLRRLQVMRQESRVERFYRDHGALP